jgi:hypothetical protein
LWRLVSVGPDDFTQACMRSGKEQHESYGATSFLRTRSHWGEVGKRKAALWKKRFAERAERGGRMNAAMAQEFDEWYAQYPRKIAPLVARKAYEKARKLATAEAILAGAMLYAQHCSREQRFQAHPTSWLNQGRWMDELPGVRQTQATDWYEDCRRLHNNECGLSQWKHAQRVDIDRIKAEAS